LITSDIFEWILDQIPNVIVGVTMLYSSETHGWSKQKFHEKTDIKGAGALTLMKSSSKAGHIFGGFSMHPWASPYLKGRWINDPDAFLFSIHPEKKVYKVKKPEKAIYVGSTYGPVFGYFDIQIQFNGEQNLEVC
jgi:hypothetical protein